MSLTQRISLDLIAYQKLLAYEKACPQTEIQGRLIMDPKDPFHITDVVILPQSVSAAFAENVGHALADELQEWITKYGEEHAIEMFSNIKGIWHVHPSGMSSHSSTDTGSFKNLLQEQNDDFFVSIIVTHNDPPKFGCYICMLVKETNKITQFLPSVVLAKDVYREIPCTFEVELEDEAYINKSDELYNIKKQIIEEQRKFEEQVKTLRNPVTALQERETNITVELNDIIKKNYEIPESLQRECSENARKKVKTNNGVVGKPFMYSTHMEDIFPMNRNADATTCRLERVFIGGKYCRNNCLRRKKCDIFDNFNGK